MNNIRGTKLACKINFNIASLNRTKKEAIKNYNGYLFLYFFDETSLTHSKILAQCFNDSSTANFINTHFSRIAIDTNNIAGMNYLKEFHPKADLHPDNTNVIKIINCISGYKASRHGVLKQESSLAWFQKALIIGETMTR